jgi:undecaprenyl-diphosphatase
VLVPLAAAVAYSRVHIGVHYPSDVVAGVAIGIGAGALAQGLAASARPQGGAPQADGWASDMARERASTATGAAR